jgi:hypothetical protein
MTREMARRLIASEMDQSDLHEFEQYAKDGESFEGTEFWRGFESANELIHDFRLFVTASDVRLVAC